MLHCLPSLTLTPFGLFSFFFPRWLLFPVLLLILHTRAPWALLYSGARRGTDGNRGHTCVFVFRSTTTQQYTRIPNASSGQLPTAIGPAGTRCICPIRQRYYPRAIEAQPRQEGRATAIPLPLLLTFFLLLVLFLFSCLYPLPFGLSPFW